jgi:hypothetical protein
VGRHRSPSAALGVLGKMWEKADRVGIVRVVGQVLYDMIRCLRAGGGDQTAPKQKAANISEIKKRSEGSGNQIHQFVLSSWTFGLSNFLASRFQSKLIAKFVYLKIQKGSAWNGLGDYCRFPPEMGHL